MPERPYSNVFLSLLSGVFNSARKMDFQTNTTLTVLSTGYIHSGENNVFEDYDAVKKSTVKKKNISNVLQKVSADSAFDPAKRRRFGVVIAQGEASLYWFV